jgi:hypothetical protein
MWYADYRSAKAVQDSQLEERFSRGGGLRPGWWSRQSSQLALRLGRWLVDVGEELEERAALPAMSDGRQPRSLEQSKHGALLL